MIDGEKYTIQDVVLFEANVVGTVQVGAPRTEKERTLRKVNAISSVGSST